jgi:RimJ/RimL family protein N-acetyltransferase
MTADPIRTERLILRPLDLVDAPRIARYVGDPGVARMMASFPLQQTVVGAEGMVLIRQALEPHRRGGVFAIDLPGEGLIGMIGAEARQDDVEIGYWVGRPWWGFGYATEALRAVADIATGLRHGPVVAGHFADNPASGRALEKAGFVYTGEVTPRFSLARGESAPTCLMRLAA